MIERTTLHGTMCCVSNIGVLITGQPGTGKSTLAFTLLNKQQQLISDDATDVYRYDSTLITRCPPAIQNKLWINGFGLIDAKKHWGTHSIKMAQRLELIIALCDDDSQQTDSETILGITIPKIYLRSNHHDSKKINHH